MKYPIHELALECVKNYKRSEKDLIDVLVKMDASKEYLHLGVSSLFRYCVEKLALSESETQRFIQVSRKAEQVPALRRAIDEGVLTVSKASRVAPVINTTNQEMWIQKARTLTHREIEKAVVSAQPKPLRKERLEARTEDFSELRLNIPRTLEIKLRRAQEVLRTRSLTETIEKMTDLALKQKDPVEKAKRLVGRVSGTPRIVADIPQVDDSNKKIKNNNENMNNVLISNSMNNNKYEKNDRNIISTKNPTMLKKGTHNYLSLALHKPARTPIPTSLKHAVYLRDHGKCAFNNCGEMKWVEVHHIQPLAMGGKHSLDNLMLLCSSHHAWMHASCRRTRLP